MNIFQDIRNRKNTKSAKWDGLQEVFGTDDLIPLWVADMDFPAPDAVVTALKERAEHGIFGYTLVDEEVKQTITKWLKRRHKWLVPEQWLSFSPGVVTSIDMAIQALTSPGDEIIIQTPVYTPFFNSIRNHGRQIVENPLVLKDGRYEIDFENLDEKLKNAKALLFCSPHNPVGRVWTQEELEKVASLCQKHSVTLLTDEIHCDLIYEGSRHIPIASLPGGISKRTVTFMSPSKTFNLAGLQASFIVTENAAMKRKIDNQILIQGHKNLNTMGITAMQAAFEHGEEWLHELMNTITANRDYAINELESNLPGIHVIRPEGTYLLWVDCTTLGLESMDLKKFMIEKARVGLNAGTSYGSGGEPFMRINLACQRSTLQEGIERIINAVKESDLLS
ncbi:PatB family C-S lyase [Aciduricibacillus chroicocephali]|uniref:cysteine-S-conjugate beta-lyase n=1 Tax=Aciduricibacillus chroicocephali TaxID=3054939 RepID=A0ABY9KTK3_9BACI|nr:PatB family C-S lyase [Bacillaceae bacterium 44XB]